MYSAGTSSLVVSSNGEIVVAKGNAVSSLDPGVSLRSSLCALLGWSSGGRKNVSWQRKGQALSGTDNVIALRHRKLVNLELASG